MDDPRLVPECPKCADWIQHAERLERKISRQSGEISELTKQVKALQQKLAGTKKDSTNSSKPPSSDIVKPPKRLKPGERRKGGQPGHGPQQRRPFELREIDHIQLHTHESCPQCSGPVEQVSSTRVLQQVELVTKPTLVTEHLRGTCHCGACGQTFTQRVPREIAAAGLFGPRLTAWVAYLKGDCHASFSTIQKLLQETCGLKVTTAMLAKICQKVSRSLQAPYEALQREIPRQTQLNADETSHRENGKLQWTWVFRARQFTFFCIDPTRSGSVLDFILGPDFAGTVGSDYYSVYRGYLDSHPLAKAQFCLAHLTRDVKALQLLPDEREQQYAHAVLAELTELFRLWHARVDVTDEAAWRSLLIAQGEQLDRVATERVPDSNECWKIARRFERHAPNYLRFTREPGLEPTNNAAEQAIRQVVIDRHVTQGTRSPRGRTWCARIWTTIATCRQHGRNLLSFLEKSYRALLTNTPPPSLLPA